MLCCAAGQRSRAPGALRAPYDPGRHRKPCCALAQAFSSDENSHTTKAAPSAVAHTPKKPWTTHTPSQTCLHFHQPLRPQNQHSPQPPPLMLTARAQLGQLHMAGGGAAAGCRLVALEQCRLWRRNHPFTGNIMDCARGKHMRAWNCSLLLVLKLPITRCNLLVGPPYHHHITGTLQPAQIRTKPSARMHPDATLQPPPQHTPFIRLHETVTLHIAAAPTALRTWSPCAPVLACANPLCAACTGPITAAARSSNTSTR